MVRGKWTTVMRALIPATATGWLVVVLLIYCGVGAGCQAVGDMEAAGGAGGGSSSSAAARLEIAVADYDAGRYDRAYQHASVVYHATSGMVRDRAAYLLGLSAYQLNRHDEARTRLTRLVRDNHPTLAADAAATLGLMAMDSGHPEEAVGHFRFAATRLADQDRAQARFLCGKAYQQMQQWGAAKSQFMLARASSTDPEFRAAVEDEMAVTGFTLQLGAFADLDNARNIVDDFLADGLGAKIGVPWILERRDPDGSTLYLVQAGRFSAHERAVQAGRTIPGPTIVVPLAAGRVP